MIRDPSDIDLRRARRLALAALVAALVAPAASAESSLQTAASSKAVSASAHLDFRIVIPPVVGLAIDAHAAPFGRAPRVALFGNTRQLLLTAQAADGARREPSAAGQPAQLFVAGRHRVLAEDAGCAVGAARMVAASGQRPGAAVIDREPIICTVAMP
jgi:hypothetical protein